MSHESPIRASVLQRRIYDLHRNTCSRESRDHSDSHTRVLVGKPDLLAVDRSGVELEPIVAINLTLRQDIPGHILDGAYSSSEQIEISGSPSSFLGPDAHP